MRPCATAPRTVKPLRGSAAQLLLLPARHSRGTCRGPIRPGIGGQEAPAYGDAWASLAIMCVQDYAQGYNLQADSLATGLAAARRAVEAAPSNYMAYCSLAQALFFQRNSRASASPPSGPPHSIPWTVTFHRSSRRVGNLHWRLRTRPRAGRASQATQSQPSRMVLVCRLLQRLPTVRLPQRTQLRPQSESARPLVSARKPWPLPAASSEKLTPPRKALRDLLKLRPDFAATVRKNLEQMVEPRVRRAPHRRLAQSRIEDRCRAKTRHSKPRAKTKS